jgi:5'-3' exoribonuclease 2
MTSPESPIIDFYPLSFQVDLNGAPQAWMGVDLIPFIDTERLIKAMKEADQDQENLTPEERERN